MWKALIFPKENVSYKIEKKNLSFVKETEIVSFSKAPLALNASKSI